MADWQDGAEYAPAERPDGFATPRTAALSAAPPIPHPAEGLPLQAPDGFQPSPTPGPALSELVPSTTPARDPRQSFESGMTITEGTAWGSAHSGPGGQQRTWDPTQPIVTSSSFGSLSASGPSAAGPDASQQWGAPDPTSQFAPPTGAPVVGAPAPLPWDQATPSGQNAVRPYPGGPAQVPTSDVMSVARTMGYALVITLLAGILIKPIAFVVLVAAIPLSLMAKASKQTLMRVAAVAAALVLMIGLLAPGDRDTLDAIFAYSRWACFLVLLTDAWIIRRQLAKGRR